MGVRKKIGPAVNPVLWERFRKFATILGKSAQTALEEAMEEYMKNHADEARARLKQILPTAEDYQVVPINN